MRVNKIHKALITGFVFMNTLYTALPAFAQEGNTLLPANPLTNQQSVSKMTEYRLSKYDVINIAIIGFDEASFKDIMVGPDGYVNLPYAGTVKLSGLTIPEATKILTEKLGGYIKIPGIAVMIKQYAPRKVYVMGAVNQQGIFSLNQEYMNVFAALSSAGGISKRGRTKKIAVVRVVDNKVQVQEIDIKKFIEKQDVSQNIPLQDGDMIYVPQSGKIDLQEDIMPILGMFAMYKTITN